MCYNSPLDEKSFIEFDGVVKKLLLLFIGRDTVMIVTDYLSREETTDIFKSIDNLIPFDAISNDADLIIDDIYDNDDDSEEFIKQRRKRRRILPNVDCKLCFRSTVFSEVFSHIVFIRHKRESVSVYMHKKAPCSFIFGPHAAWYEKWCRACCDFMSTKYSTCGEQETM